jgi:O-antigen/teichoic acid export membrane protein
MADRLIPAWVGSGFSGSVVVAQILAVVIAFRVGQSTAGVVLKGAGQHKMLAITNAVVAVANVLLSVIWIQSYGLAGQAMGTLVPVAAASVFYLWPAACKRVGVSVSEAFKCAVWPTIWPAPVFVAVVWLLRGVMPTRLSAVLLTILIAALCYAAVFLAFAITPADRSLYLSKITSLTRLRRPVQPQAA